MDYDNYLEHYGVKGMKWGVRKKDKESSSKDHDTADKARKKARKSGGETLSNKELKIIQERENLKRNTKTFDKKHDRVSDDKAQSRSIEKTGKFKGTKSLSNAELETAIRRMELENQYAKLSESKSSINKGRSFVQDIAKDVLTNVVTNMATDAAGNAAASGADAARKYYNAQRTTRAITR